MDISQHALRYNYKAEHWEGIQTKNQRRANHGFSKEAFTSGGTLLQAAAGLAAG